MRYRLRSEGLEFLESAPKRFVFDADVAAPRVDVFAAISADPATWTWFPGLSQGSYESPGGHGVGSIRQVRMGRTGYRETILAWDEPSRWAYRVDESSAPLAHALAEDWTFEDRVDHTTVRWTFAIDPRPLFNAGLPVAKLVMGRLFRRAMRNLSTQCADRRSSDG